MQMFHWLGKLVVLVSLTLVGCNGSDATPAAQEYPIKGTVIAVDSSRPSVKLDHEEIPGLMKGMKMDFPVENAAVLEGLAVGDKVQGRLKAQSGKHTITHLEKR